MSSTSYESYINYIMNIPKFFDNAPSMDKKTEFTRTVIEYVNNHYLRTGKADKSNERKASPEVIHVAGTNGKGSVCAYLNSILISAGYRVGLFTSPHLIDIRERIQINNELISKDDFAVCYEMLDSLMKMLDISYMTFFEYLFYVGIIYFYVNQVDYIILETGLGGRLDATNTIDKKSLTIITEIGFDHVQYLGNTIKQISAEKAGIVRAGCPLVYLNKREEASSEILTRATLAGLTTDDIYELNTTDFFITSSNEEMTEFTINNSRLFDSVDSFRISTGALYQCENAYLAIAGISVLNNKRIRPDHVKQGLISMNWPCRMERIYSRVYIDGAHNEDGIRALLNTVGQYKGNKTLLFAVVNDKDYTSMIDHIVHSQLFDNIVITAVLGERQVKVNDIVEVFNKACLKEETIHNLKVTALQDIRDALKYSLSIKKDGFLFISGSLYLAGSVKKIITELLQ